MIDPDEILSNDGIFQGLLVAAKHELTMAVEQPELRKRCQYDVAIRKVGR